MTVDDSLNDCCNYFGYYLEVFFCYGLVVFEKPVGMDGWIKVI
jgi:hypothetical protein